MTERNFHQVRREIRLMSLINYDGAVQLLGSFEDESTIYIVQEMCAKGDLFKKLIRGGGMLEEGYVAGGVVLPLLLTLEHLHARGIYHRDIKPENIFFTRDGRFKLGDFGLAIDATLERSKSRVGTLDYMSPEVVSLPTADERKRMEAAGRPVVEQPYGEKCDIWAVGVLAFELLVGRPPFEVADEAETRKKIMFETTLKFPPHVGPEAVGFIRAALAKSAPLRPGASELVHHPWLRPHLLNMAAGAAAAGAAGDGATLRPQHRQPSQQLLQQEASLVASSNKALAAAAAKAQAAAAPASSSGSTVGGAAAPSAAAAAAAAAAGGAASPALSSGSSSSSNSAGAGDGRSASFSTAALGGRLGGGYPSGLGLGLQISLEAAAAAGAAMGQGPSSAGPLFGGGGGGFGGGAGSLSASGALGAHLAHLAHHLNFHHGGAASSSGMASPSMPTTPGPYGPPGMSRKPIWETDASGGSFTAVRTTGLSGELLLPASSPTSPRGPPAGAGKLLPGGGSNSPLLKAALNANLARSSAVAQQAAAPPYQQHQQQQQQQHGGPGGAISSNVKQRLKDYFVARNTELLPASNAAAAAAAAAAAGLVAAGSDGDCLAAHHHQLQQRQLH